MDVLNIKGSDPMNTDDLFDEYLATLDRGAFASNTGFADFLVARVDKLETQLAALAWARWIPVTEPPENTDDIWLWDVDEPAVWNYP